MVCRKHRYQLRAKAGFTLVETLVSLALLLMFFASTAAIFGVVTNIVGEARVRTVATSLAEEKLEVVRNLSYADIGTIGGIPNGALPQSEVVTINGQDFTVETTVIYIDDDFDDQAPTDVIPTDYKRVRVSISWGGVFPSINPIVATTDVAPNGLESNEGGGTLMITIINSSGEPVSNADVSIQNSSVNPNINLNISSNDSGQVLLPGAPACSDCYIISVSKSGFTQERTYSLTEIANPLKPHATVIEGEVTGLTFSIDQTATINIETKGSRDNNYPPFAGVQFKMRGTKTLGTNDLDEPVYKYDKTHASGPGGLLTINDIEPDTYEIWIPSGSSIDFAGSAPISPFKVLPGVDRTLIIVTEPSTPHNLLVIVQDLADKPISTASALIKNYASFEASDSAGPLGKADNGQVLFTNLIPGNYQVYASQSGFISASASATVNGDSKVYLLLQNE